MCKVCRAEEEKENRALARRMKLEFDDDFTRRIFIEAAKEILMESMT